MRKLTKPLAIMIAVILAIVPCTPCAAHDGRTVNIAFIHDLHSYLEGLNEETDEGFVRIGGAARIKTLIDERKSLDPQTLVVDAGDFSMGTLYQTVYGDTASELRTLGLMGVEYTTLGNHEFDFKAEGLCEMLDTAYASGDPIPQFVVSNIDWDLMKQSGLSAEQQLYYDTFGNHGFKDYVIADKGGVRIALFGLFGKEALRDAPSCELLFKDPIESAKKIVERIKEDESPDMIVCLSHCGTGTDKKSEDEELAKAVSDIDVIISAHSHKKIEEPIIVGDTTIVSAECYGKYLGLVSMSQNGEGKWNVASYDLCKVTDKVAEDPGIVSALSEFTKNIDRDYMSLFGYEKNQILAHNAYRFDTVSDCYDIHTEHNLGDLIADGFMYTTDNADLSDDPVDVAVCASGCIRGTFIPGDITAEDAFNSYSLGIGPDGRSGYPLIYMYLTGEELISVCEIDASMSDIMNVARLYMNGLEFTFDPYRPFLNKVCEAHLVDANGNARVIEKDRVYRIVCDLYMGKMLASVKDRSYGLIKITPKHADATPITDLEDSIFYRNGEEIKAWQAVADYIDSFEKGADGIGSVPKYYKESIHDRKAVLKSLNPVNLFCNLNTIGIVIYALILLAVILAVFVITIPYRRRRKKMRRSKEAD